ncbi:hypothetical protein CVT24_012827 [Panaeolus cyanescens]|uniref:CCHC-type domain-containing protein n=1 Tax=Panaeolus cyanescens TaxID=181874 RepID=A0A409YJM7_9AGAR|nr:hypothetical protein CVT24_012827 [Panaeolus cyanescens]
MDKTNARMRSRSASASTVTPSTKRSAEKEKQGQRVTRQTTGKESGIGEELEMIKDAEKGRKYLEEHALLVPAGQPLTANMAAHCLHQIAIMKGNIPQPTKNAIRALAFMLEQTDVNQVNELLHDSFNAELGNFAEEMRMLVQDAKDKIKDEAEETAVCTRMAIDSMRERAVEEMKEGGKEAAKTYAEVAAAAKTNFIRGEAGAGERKGNSEVWAEKVKKGPSVYEQVQTNVDPEMLARSLIYKRQVMIEGVPRDTRVGLMSNGELVKEINEKLKQIVGDAPVGVRSAQRHTDGAILIEMDGDYGRAWIRVKKNTEELCRILGEGAKIRPRYYEILAKAVPIGVEPTELALVEEVEEVNDMEGGTVSKMRWVKPIERRSISQQFAHMILTMTDVDEANRLIATGVKIAGKRVKVVKVLKDPIRCLKCQRYGHFAKECTQDEDTCGHCAQKGHRTKFCQNPTKRACVSCNAGGHASYSRDCPEFKRQQAIKNGYTPENIYPFFQTDEAWTWSKTVPQDYESWRQEPGGGAGSNWLPEPKKGRQSGLNQKQRRAPPTEPRADREKREAAGQRSQDEGWRRQGNGKGPSLSQQTKQMLSDVLLEKEEEKRKEDEEKREELATLRRERLAREESRRERENTVEAEEGEVEEPSEERAGANEDETQEEETANPILQQNLNKSQNAHLELINDKLSDKYDIVLVKEPHITTFKNIRTPTNFRSITPDVDRANGPTIRSVIWVNRKISTQTWKEMKVPGTGDISAIQLRGDYGKLTIFNIYSPNDSAAVERKLGDYLFEKGEEISAGEEDHVLWAGDFNRHHPMWDRIEDEHLFTRHALRAAAKLINLLGKHGMVMALPQGIPTLQHMVTKKHSRPDNVFCTEATSERIARCEVLHGERPACTDHYPIVTEVELGRTEAEEEERRNYRMADWKKINKNIEKRMEGWRWGEDIESREEFEEAAEWMTANLKGALEEEVKPTKPLPDEKRWWTRELETLKKAKNRIASKSFKFRALMDHPIHEQARKAARDFAAEVIKAKRTRWEEWLNEASTRDLWTANGYLKNPTGDGGRTRIPTLKAYNDYDEEEEVVSNEDKARVLANSFFPPPPYQGHANDGEVYPDPLPDPKELTEKTVERHIKKLSPYKASMMAEGDDTEEAVEKLWLMMNREGGGTDWSMEHNSKFEVSKSVVMHLTKKRERAEWDEETGAGIPVLEVDGEIVKRVRSFKYLGVFVDDELRWKVQEAKACEKATKWTLQFKRLAKPSSGINLKLMRQLYNATVIPKIAYAADVWYTPPTKPENAKKNVGSVAALKKLTKVQRMATLTITGAPATTPTESLDAHAGTLPMDLALLKMCHRSFVRMATLPDTHPLHDMIEEEATKMPKNHLSQVSKLARIFDLDPRKVEKTSVVPFKVTGCRAQTRVTIRATMERAMKEEKKDRAEAERDAYTGELGKMWNERWRKKESRTRGDTMEDNVPMEEFHEAAKGLTRVQISLVIQARTDHLPLNARLYKIKKSETSKCPRCNDRRGGVRAEENVQHVVYECRAYRKRRRELWKEAGGANQSIRELTANADKAKALIRFLVDTGRLDKKWKAAVDGGEADSDGERLSTIEEDVEH